jgi:hypothetical protein
LPSCGLPAACRYGIGSSVFFCCPGGAGGVTGGAGTVVVSAAPRRRVSPGGWGLALLGWVSSLVVWPGGAVAPRRAQPVCGVAGVGVTDAGGAGCDAAGSPGVALRESAGPAFAPRLVRDRAFCATSVWFAAARRVNSIPAGDLCDARDEAEAVMEACGPEAPSGLLACAPSGSDTPGRRPKASMPTTRATSQTQAITTADTAA